MRRKGRHRHRIRIRPPPNKPYRKCLQDRQPQVNIPRRRVNRPEMTFRIWLRILQRMLASHGLLPQRYTPAIYRMKQAIQADPLTAFLQISEDIASERGKAPYEMRESKVPSSRFGRLWQYAGLGTSMAFGAVGEGLRRVTGGGAGGSLMLSAANMERLVARLSKMRGAALKLGQMVSFQGASTLYIERG